jgi:hypothetical protein
MPFPEMARGFPIGIVQQDRVCRLGVQFDFDLDWRKRGDEGMKGPPHLSAEFLRLSNDVARGLTSRLLNLCDKKGLYGSGEAKQ